MKTLLLLILLCQCTGFAAENENLKEVIRYASKDLPEDTSIAITFTSSGKMVKGTLPGMEFVQIPAGTFLMGSPVDENGRDNDETQHKVTLSAFQYMTTEVTQAMWREVMGDSPSKFKGDDLPVEQVSWSDCQDFIDKLNQLDPGKGYRLPTEAEWEYVCRAGTATRFYSGQSDSALHQAGWFTGNAGHETHPAAKKQPNAWGLYDMHGNVWEWCQDWYGTYPDSSVTDPRGTQSGSHRVYRGGSWGSSARGCRAANRYSYTPSFRRYDIGLRLLRVGN